MVFKTIDKERTLSGKEFTTIFSSFEKETKEAFSVASTWIQDYNKWLKTTDGVSKNFISTAKSQNQELGNYFSKLNGAPATMDGYTTSLKGVSLSSKVAALGMKTLNIAMNIGLMLAFSLAVKGITYALDQMSTSLKEQQEKVKVLNDKYTTITQEIKELTDKKITSPLDNPLSDAENKRLDYLKEYQKELKNLLAAEKEKEVLSKWFGAGNLNPFAKTQAKETDNIVGTANNADIFLNETLKQVSLTDIDTSEILNQYYNDYNKDFITLLEKRNSLEKELKNASYSNETLSKLKAELDKINPAIDKTKSAMNRLLETGQINNPAEKGTSYSTSSSALAINQPSLSRVWSSP